MERFSPTLLTDTVRKPSIKKRFIGRAAFGEAEVTFALERFQRSEQHRLATADSADGKKCLERANSCWPDSAVRCEVGVILSVAVEHSEGALEERRRHSRPHVHPSVEQLGGNAWTPLRDLIKV